MSLLFPIADQSDKPFEQFVTHFKNQSVFEPQWDREEDHLFCTSLASIRDFLKSSDPSYSVEASQPFAVDLGFVESPLPNAFANRLGDVLVCGIHSALPVVIHEFALFCFAQANFFPEIGNAASEASPLADLSSPPGLALLLRQLHGDQKHFAAIAPVDAHRMVAAQLLAQLMMRFVWFHEVGHGSLGHIDYLRSLKPLDGTSLDFGELHYDDVSVLNVDIDARKLQILEIEADSYALAKCLNIQLGTIENIDLIKTLPNDLRLRLSIFGIYAMSWLLETMAGVMKRGKLNITHPAPVRRLQLNHSMILWELNDLGADTKALVTHSLKQFQSILATLGGEWNQTDHFDPVGHREVFDAMRDELTPFRYHSAS